MTSFCALLLAAVVSSGPPTFCWKKTYPRAARAPAEENKCRPKEELTGPLCFPRCKPGFGGTGPVCWQDCPKELPFNCGAGCAASQGDCVGNVVNMVAAPVEVVAMVVLAVATDGAGVGVVAGAKVASRGVVVVAKTGVKVVMSASARAAAKTAAKTVLKQKARQMGKEIAQDTLDSVAGALVQLKESGQFDWKDLDPTGLANLVDAFAKPICQ